MSNEAGGDSKSASQQAVNRWYILFWCLLVGFVGYHAIRHYRKSEEGADRLTAFTEDFSTSDFQAWWRAFLRMHADAAEPGADVDELRAQVASRNSELASSKPREADLQASADFRLGRGILNLLTLGSRRRSR